MVVSESSSPTRVLAKTHHEDSGRSYDHQVRAERKKIEMSVAKKSLAEKVDR
jgi:hypothetical protein